MDNELLSKLRGFIYPEVMKSLSVEVDNIPMNDKIIQTLGLVLSVVLSLFFIKTN